MKTPMPRRESFDGRVPGRFGRTSAWAAALVAAALLAGCATNEAARPMKPTSATASKPITPSTTLKPSAAATPASAATTQTKPAPSTAPLGTQAKAPTPTTRSPATSAPATSPAEKPVAPVVTKAPAATTPRPIAAAPKASESHPAPVTSTATTADFSTGLLYPDPDPDTAASRTVSLCEFKNGRWTTIMTAPVQTYGGDARGVTFRSVPVGRMVLPGYVVGDEVLPAANPWAVETSGKVRELKGPCATCPSNEPPVLTLELRPAPAGAASQRMTIEPGEYGVMAVRAERNRQYTLSYWDGGWKAIGEATMTGDKPVRIEGIPSKRVLWLESEGESLTLPVLP